MDSIVDMRMFVVIKPERVVASGVTRIGVTQGVTINMFWCHPHHGLLEYPDGKLPFHANTLLGPMN